jgi:signal peptidase I
MYCIMMMFLPIIAVIVFLGDFPTVMVGLGTLILVSIAFNIWSMRDAKAIARQMAAIDYEPQEYNRPIIYGLMIFTLLPYAVGIVLFLRENTFEAFYLPTASMSPTLIPGDRVLVSNHKIETALFSRGDLVVFRSPGNRRQAFIKRIVALAGDTVEVREGKLLINGRLLDREPIPEGEKTSAMKVVGKQAFYESNGDRRYTIFVEDDEKANSNENAMDEQKVPIGSYFVLGDNRSESRDSRQLGAIPHADIIGQVLVNFWPSESFNRFGKIR